MDPREAARKAADPRVAAILEILAETYPDARCALEHENPFQLLIATILSAQCTDKRVNIITRRLFPRLPRPEDYLAISQEELEELIRDCGLYREKARNIRATCRILVERYGGEVPRTLEELIQLPGVGRKTANVVLSNAFGVPAIAVDTHVLRVSNRLGLASSPDPLKTERQLMEAIPRELWSQAHHWLIHHGRNICHARNPACPICPLLRHCPEGQRRLGPGAGAETGAPAGGPAAGGADAERRVVDAPGAAGR
ncbi:MAG: endonuclease III [Bacillota bacterium]|nr:MAG: endonuclease III [Bacillota bacterium]